MKSGKARAKGVGRTVWAAISGYHGQGVDFIEKVDLGKRFEVRDFIS